MGDDRALSAMARIERALARVEAAAARPTPPSAPSADTSDEPLRRSHEALKSTVADAVARLDRLLAEER